MGHGSFLFQDARIRSFGLLGSSVSGIFVRDFATTVRLSSDLVIRFLLDDLKFLYNINSVEHITSRMFLHPRYPSNES